MTCDEVRDLAQNLGCWDAAMLDGGGSSSHAALAEGVFSGTCGSFGRHHAGCLMGCVCCQTSHTVGCFGKQIGSCRIVGSFSAHRERQLAPWRWPWNPA